MVDNEPCTLNYYCRETLYNLDTVSTNRTCTFTSMRRM